MVAKSSRKQIPQGKKPQWSWSQTGRLIQNNTVREKEIKGKKITQGMNPVSALNNLAFGSPLYAYINILTSVAVFFPSYSSPVLMDHMVLFSGGWCPLLLFDCHLSSSSVFKTLHNKSI